MSRTRPSPKIMELAQRLLAYEAAAPNTPSVLCVSEKLRRPLSKLAGSSGFRSLLTRSLTLAKAEVPRLGDVRVNPDGSLEGWSELGNHNQDAEAGVILIAQLLGLLGTLIGEGLMLSLVLDAWPDFTAIDTLEKQRS
jgi:hypothetical protein